MSKHYKPFSRKNPDYKKNKLIAQNKRRQINPDKYRLMGQKSEFNRRLKRYGLSIQEYGNLLLAQNQKCAICTVEFADLGRQVHVDHSHITGKVRGILCHHCNILLGNAKDNIIILQQAVKYLSQ